MIQNFQDSLTNLIGIEFIIFISFIVLFGLRLCYLILFTGRILLLRKSKNIPKRNNPLSLILTIRNEEENLKNNLPPILSIKDVDFEIIAVDDYSQDNSFIVLGKFRQEDSRLKISLLNQETRFSIKMAQNIALKAATNDWVLITPVSYGNASYEWISEFTKVETNEKTVAIAYAGIEKSKGFFNHIYRIENYLSHLKSVGFILNRLPFVYTDENVAFQKNKYFEGGGYGQKMKEHYANLELLINSFITKKSTTLLFTPETSIQKTETISPSNYFELLKKGFRVEKHLSISKKAGLAFEEFTRLAFLPLTIAVIILIPELWPLFIGLLGIKLIAHLLIIKITQNRLNQHKIFISSLVYDLVAPYFKFFFRWSFNRKSRQNKWRNKN